MSCVEYDGDGVAHINWACIEMMKKKLVLVRRWPWPWPPDPDPEIAGKWGPRPEIIDLELTMVLRDELSMNPEFAGAISEAVSAVVNKFIKIDKDGTLLDVDRTFAASFSVIEKPQQAGQVISEVGGKQQAAYITEPSITKVVCKQIQRQIIR